MSNITGLTPHGGNANTALAWYEAERIQVNSVGADSTVTGTAVTAGVWATGDHYYNAGSVAGDLRAGNDDMEMYAFRVIGDSNTIRHGGSDLIGGDDRIEMTASNGHDSGYAHVIGDAYNAVGDGSTGYVGVQGGDDLLMGYRWETATGTTIVGDLFHARAWSSTNGGDDTIIGTQTGSRDDLVGDFWVTHSKSNLRGGDDLLFGLGGNDRLWGDGVYANGTIYSLGNDTLDGGTGNDEIKGDVHDPGYGIGGNDLLFGGAGDDSLYGGAGNDTLDGDGLTTDVAVDTRDDGAIDVSEAAPTVATHDDRLDGGAGNDVLYGDASVVAAGATAIATGDDVLRGGTGDDLIFGDFDVDGTGLGASVLRFEGGDDTIDGGDGDDEAHGGAGNDSMDGGDGRDLLFGAWGDDSLIGGGGDDTFEGGAGNDVLTFAGSAEGERFGIDVAAGGEGSDTFRFVDGGVAVITDFTPGEDRIDLSGIWDAARAGAALEEAVDVGATGDAQPGDTDFDAMKAFLFNNFWGNGVIRMDDEDVKEADAPLHVVLLGVDVTDLTADDFVF